MIKQQGIRTERANASKPLTWYKTRYSMGHRYVNQTMGGFGESRTWLTALRSEWSEARRKASIPLTSCRTKKENIAFVKRAG